MNYYHRFKLITNLFFFKSLLKSAYSRGIKDVEKLGIKPVFNKNDFSCLLCGVAGETTAEEFIKFVLEKNKKAIIVIIDIGKDQVKAVSKMVKEKYADSNIEVRQMNALDLTKHFKAKSFDWIETDGFIEYFDKLSLKKLLQTWKMLLKNNGFITTRDFASKPPLGFVIDKFRYWFIKKILLLTPYIHTKKELDAIFKQNGFKFVSGLTLVPTFRRYALVN